MVSPMAHPMSVMQARRIAVALDCDPRSVLSEARGKRVRGIVGEKIREYFASNGITPAVAVAMETHLGIASIHRGRPQL